MKLPDELNAVPECVEGMSEFRRERLFENSPFSGKAFRVSIEKGFVINWPRKNVGWENYFLTSDDFHGLMDFVCCEGESISIFDLPPVYDILEAENLSEKNNCLLVSEVYSEELLKDFCRFLEEIYFSGKIFLEVFSTDYGFGRTLNNKEVFERFNALGELPCYSSYGFMIIECAIRMFNKKF